MKNILILTADMGFGHRSAANAIAAALRETHPLDCTVQIDNPLDDKRLPLILRRSQSNYDRVVRELPQLFTLAYTVAQTRGTSTIVHQTVGAMLLRVMRELVEKSQPDAIVAPYPLYCTALSATFARTRTRIPLLTVVTDMAPVHPIWFHKAADLCLVGTEEVRTQALACGMTPEKVKVTGIPVHPDLPREARPASAVRAELGWRSDLTTVLAVGSRRVRNLSGILDALNHSGLPLQLIAVAGGDEALYRQLKGVRWHVPTRVYNFVNNMPALMHAADCVVCKAGGLIVTESLACGKPLLLTDLIEGQETSNARYVVDGGAGELARSPMEGMAAMYHWLANGGKELSQRTKAARRLGRPKAAFAVARLAWAAAARGPQPLAKSFRARRA
jgi:1,2-diacylglycerol 3-beta-galactosyltransferase